jgi:hypothetical protein
MEISMKVLIIKALNSAFELMNKKIPLTKKKSKSLQIQDVAPIDLFDFMTKNNIPNDCYFDAEGEDFEIKYPLLCWEIDIPTTDEDQLTFKKTRFTGIAGVQVHHTLLNNGYVKKNNALDVVLVSKLLYQTTVYDMYINKEWEKLVEYYSFFLEKK